MGFFLCTQTKKLSEQLINQEPSVATEDSLVLFYFDDQWLIQSKTKENLSSLCYPTQHDWNLFIYTQKHFSRTCPSICNDAASMRASKHKETPNQQYIIHGGT